jgi:hypothetical protein
MNNAETTETNVTVTETDIANLVAAEQRVAQAWLKWAHAETTLKVVQKKARACRDRAWVELDDRMRGIWLVEAKGQVEQAKVDARAIAETLVHAAWAEELQAVQAVQAALKNARLAEFGK